MLSNDDLRKLEKQAKNLSRLTELLREYKSLNSIITDLSRLILNTQNQIDKSRYWIQTTEEALESDNPNTVALKACINDMHDNIEKGLKLLSNYRHDYNSARFMLQQNIKQIKHFQPER